MHGKVLFHAQKRSVRGAYPYACLQLVLVDIRDIYLVDQSAPLPGQIGLAAISEMVAC